MEQDEIEIRCPLKSSLTDSNLVKEDSLKHLGKPQEDQTNGEAEVFKKFKQEANSMFFT